jgi:hypothetical protein
MRKRKKIHEDREKLEETVKAAEDLINSFFDIGM